MPSWTASPASSTSTTRRGGLVRWNKRSELLTGYSAEELPRLGVLDWTSGDEAGTLRVRAAQRQVRLEGHAEVEIELAMKHGQRVPYLLTTTKVDIGGKTYLVVVGLDTTGRRQAEEALRQNQERFRIIFDASPLMIALNDPETTAYGRRERPLLRSPGPPQGGDHRQVLPGARPGPGRRQAPGGASDPGDRGDRQRHEHAGDPSWRRQEGRPGHDPPPSPWKAGPSS